MHPWFRKNLMIKKDCVEVVGREKTCFAVARTARKENPDALQGLHAENMMFILDEASGIDQKIFLRVSISEP